MTHSTCYTTPESAECARIQLGALADEFYLIHISGIGWGIRDKRFKLDLGTVKTTELKDIIKQSIPVSTGF